MTHVFRLALFLSFTLTLGNAVAQPLDIGSRLELFVDDFLVESLYGDLKHHLHKPEPREVVLVTDEPWEGNTCAYYTVFQDGDLYRMYYRGSHYDEETRKSAHREVACYAESRDGIQWTKPELGLVEFAGSKENNIVWDGIGAHCLTPFKDANPDGARNGLYKAIGRGKPLGRKGLYAFQSPDGTHWSLMRPEPVITTGDFDSQNLAFWDAERGLYVDYHRVFRDKIRSIMTATSSDFVHWSEPEHLKFPDAPREHLYTNAILAYDRAPHIYLGFPTRYLPDDRQRVEPTFMTSRDGLTFKRWEEAIVPEDAPRDRGGNRSNYMAWGLLKLPGSDREYSVYATEAYYTGPDSRLRRFTYRTDGFVSVRAAIEGGALLTKPILFQGRRLVVNFVTRKNGHLRVEVQNEAGEAIQGFRMNQCRKLRGDEISGTVTWEGGETVQNLAGKPIRLRFELRQADLFSFQFE